MEMFNKVVGSYIDYWQNQPLGDLQYQHKSSLLQPFRQYYRYFKLRKRMEQVCHKIKENPTNDLANDREIQKLFESWLGVDSLMMRDEIQGDYSKCTKSFIDKAKKRWPHMDDESIFQALRNVWIMNTIQIMHHQPVELTNSIFAYSMLYPLTDNYLDDETVSLADKRLFVTRFRKRLEGLYINPLNNREEDIFNMVSLIERDFNRVCHPEVFESLLLIHEGQCMSLKQQYENLTEQQLLRLSFEKGGASVVADAYLVLGKLNESQMRFYTGYGIALQLADDLQDLKEDLMNSHYTLYNCHSSVEKRWQDTRKLMNLSEFILTLVPMQETPLKKQVSKLLERSMQLLICDAIYEHRLFYSQKTIGKINKMQSVRLEHHWKLKQLGEKWMEELKPIIAQQIA